MHSKKINLLYIILLPFITIIGASITSNIVSAHAQGFTTIPSSSSQLESLFSTLDSTLDSLYLDDSSSNAEKENMPPEKRENIQVKILENPNQIASSSQSSKANVICEFNPSIPCEANVGDNITSSWECSTVQTFPTFMYIGTVQCTMSNIPSGATFSATIGNPSIATFEWIKAKPAGTYTPTFSMNQVSCPSDYSWLCDGSVPPPSSTASIIINKKNSDNCDPEKIDKIEDRYRELIQKAQSKGWSVAADNLIRFQQGTGGVKTMEVPWLRDFSPVINAEKINQARFQKSLVDQAIVLAKGEMKPFEEYWDKTLTAFITTELYWASGTSTITSTGSFELVRIDDKVTITGDVNHHWYDVYDWHKDKGVVIPGFGAISDKDALLLQECRGAAPFEMQADWSQKVFGTATFKIEFLGNESPVNSNFNWLGP